MIKLFKKLFSNNGSSYLGKSSFTSETFTLATEGTDTVVCIFCEGNGIVFNKLGETVMKYSFFVINIKTYNRFFLLSNM